MSDALQHHRRPTFSYETRNSVFEERHDIHADGPRGLFTVKAKADPDGGNDPVWIVPGGRIVADRQQALAIARRMAGREAPV